MQTRRDQLASRPTLDGAGLPLPSPLRIAALDDGPALRVAVSRVSRHGRISGAASFEVMGWTPGHPLTCSITEHILTLRTAAPGRRTITIGRSGQIHLPSSTRRIAGISSGDHLLLIALPDLSVLAILPPATIRSTLAAVLDKAEAQA